MRVVRHNFYHRVEKFLRVEIFYFPFKNRGDVFRNFLRVERDEKFRQNFAHESFCFGAAFVLLEVVNQKLRGVFALDGLHDIFCVEQIGADEFDD